MTILNGENYQIQMITLNEENHHQQSEKVKKLFHELLESLQYDLFDLNNRINDHQIDILWINTKLELEEFKNKFSETTSNASAFDSIFLSLIEYIEKAYNIMQSVFKQLTAKTNQIIEQNNKLSNEIHTLKQDKTELSNDLQKIQTEIRTLHTNWTRKDDVSHDWLSVVQELQKKELERSEKEKKQQRKMLIRDLFNIPKEMLTQELKKYNLLEQMDVFVQPNINCGKLTYLDPRLIISLETVAKQFALTAEQLLSYLNEKKNSNSAFHINVAFKQYAQSHERCNKFSLNEFLQSIDMDLILTEDSAILELVFENVCRKIIDHRE